FPSAWDPRVAPIATKVAALRHLSFEHPVKVNYLTDTAFEKKVGVDAKEVAKHRTELDSAAALLRAAGVIGGKGDAAASVDTAQTSDVVAFYDPETKQIYVRSNSFDIYTRVTLAHELTHVLQDQHFDLVKLQQQADDSKAGSSDAFTALIEGDAMRIQNAYLAAQAAAERAQYEILASKFSDTAGQRT